MNKMMLFGVWCVGFLCGCAGSFEDGGGLESEETSSSLTLATETCDASHGDLTTWQSIQTAINAKARSGGGVVQLPGCTIAMHRALELRDRVTLRGVISSGNRTILKREDDSPGAVVTLQNVEHSKLERLYVDGENQTAGTTIRSGVTHPSGAAMVAVLGCSTCEVSEVKIVNAPAVGLELRDVQNVTVDDLVLRDIGGIGVMVRTSSQADGEEEPPPASSHIVLRDVNARDIGTWYFTARGMGAGAGIAVAKANYVTIEDARIVDTNGDAVAAYSVSENIGLVIRESWFERNKNHCVHAGGSDVIVLDNDCIAPRLNGVFVSTDWRDVVDGGPLPDPISKVRVVDNRVTMKSDGRGYPVKLGNLDTSAGINVVNGNTLRGGEHSFCIYAVDDVRLSRNVATNPLDDYIIKPESTVRLSSGSNKNTFSGKKNLTSQNECAR